MSSDQAPVTSPAQTVSIGEYADELHKPAAVSDLEPLQSIAGHTALRDGESLGDDPEQHHVAESQPVVVEPSSPPRSPEATRSTV